MSWAYGVSADVLDILHSMLPHTTRHVYIYVQIIIVIFVHIAPACQKDSCLVCLMAHTLCSQQQSDF